MKQIQIKKSTLNLLETHAAGIFKVQKEGIEYLEDTVILDIDDALYTRLNNMIDSITPSIDSVIIILCDTMEKSRQ